MTRPKDDPQRPLWVAFIGLKFEYVAARPDDGYVHLGDSRPSRANQAAPPIAMQHSRRRRGRAPAPQVAAAVATKHNATVTTSAMTTPPHSPSGSVWCSNIVSTLPIARNNTKNEAEPPMVETMRRLRFGGSHSDTAGASSSLMRSQPEPAAGVLGEHSAGPDVPPHHGRGAVARLLHAQTRSPRLERRPGGVEAERRNGGASGHRPNVPKSNVAYLPCERRAIGGEQ